MPATVRRLGLHDGVPDIEGVHRCEGADHIRGKQRNHERAHRQDRHQGCLKSPVMKKKA